MNQLFEHLSSNWVRYSDYEWKMAADGYEYLLPTADAKPKPYDPLKEADQLLLDAMDIGLQCYRKAPKATLKDAIHEFACKYGLLGLMTALPTTVHFADFKQVYLLKNQFIREEAMDTLEYLKLFFPFEMPDFAKSEKGHVLNLTDRTMIALAMTFRTDPQAMVMTFMRNNGERYDWLVEVFRDWAFTFMAAFLYYHDKDSTDETTLNLYRQGMAAFDGNTPTYHIELRDKPTIVWDFHSLLMGIKMVLSFKLTDDRHPLRMCEHCQRAFIAKRVDSKFCSAECRAKWTAKHNEK